MWSNDLNAVLLVLFLAGAAWWDVKSYRIPNRLIWVGLLAGLMMHVYLYAWSGLLESVQGILVGMAWLLPFYLLRAMGAGDVKLMGLVGAFLGPLQVSKALIFVMLAGGIMALLLVLRLKKLRQLLASLKLMLQQGLLSVAVRQMPDAHIEQSIARMPYGLAILVGVSSYLAWQHW